VTPLACAALYLRGGAEEEVVAATASAKVE